MVNAAMFLLYSPLNQGLKPLIFRPTVPCILFLLYSPLNQGLKRISNEGGKVSGLSFYSTVH